MYYYQYSRIISYVSWYSDLLRMEVPGICMLYECRPALGPTQPPIQWVLGVKRPGRGVDHPSTAEVKERVELYFKSHFGP